jgi:hypothetical protein
MSAIAGRQARTPTTSAAAYRPATAALDQSLGLSAVPAARLLRPNLDRPLHAPTTPAHAAELIRQSQHSHRTPPAAVLKSP